MLVSKGAKKSIKESNIKALNEDIEEIIKTIRAKSLYNLFALI
jgi:hypothetical protein